MRVALVNPPWRFDHSIYFGCREPHLPLEYGYARALLGAAGHEARIFDAHAEALDLPELTGQVIRFAPEMIVVTTAPSYLFWRCAPPELRVPQQTLHAIRAAWTAARASLPPPLTLVIGPHASSTPGAAIKKLHADAAVLGECEEILPRLAAPREAWGAIDAIAWADGGGIRVQGAPHQSDMSALPPLHWSADDVRRHTHHHHRFDRAPLAP